MKEETTVPPRMIVCAACLSQCGKHMVLGARHWDPLMHTTREMLKDIDGKPIKWTAGEQGFIDQYREFLTRGEAWKVAESAGQIIRRVGGDTIDGGHLFSENLY